MLCYVKFYFEMGVVCPQGIKHQTHDPAGLKNDFFFFFLSRLEPHPPTAEPHQHPALHSEPESDRQPAQTHTAVQNDRVLGLHPASVPRICKTVAGI